MASVTKAVSQSSVKVQAVLATVYRKGKLTQDERSY